MMYEYLDVMKDVWGRGTFCHTADRYNIHAQAECGLGLTGRNDPLWEKAVTWQYKDETWPWSLGDVPGNCTERYWKSSWTNIQAY